jgi:hypothetical protein
MKKQKTAALIFGKGKKLEPKSKPKKGQKP